VQSGFTNFGFLIFDFRLPADANSEYFREDVDRNSEGVLTTDEHRLTRIPLQKVRTGPAALKRADEPNRDHIERSFEARCDSKTVKRMSA